jgi:hypothetical protein
VAAQGLNALATLWNRHRERTKVVDAVLNANEDFGFVVEGESNDQMSSRTSTASGNFCEAHL